MLGAPLFLAPLAGQEVGASIQGQTAHFHWSAPVAEISRARPLMNLVEKDLAAITNWLGLASAPQGEIIWVSGKQDMQELLDFRAPSWFAAVTQSRQRRIILVMDAANGQEQLHKTLRHELVHWAMLSLGEERWAALPAWVHEGIAEVWAEQKLLGGMGVALAWPAFRNELPFLGEFNRGFGGEPYQAAQGYALAQAFFARMQRLYGQGVIAELMDSLHRGESLDRSLIHLTGLSLVENEQHLRTELGSLSRLLADFYPSFFLITTLLLMIGFPVAMRRRRQRHQRLEKKWDREDQALDYPSGEEDDVWESLP